MNSILDDLNPCDCPRCGQHESYGCSCTRIEKLEAKMNAVIVARDMMSRKWADVCQERGALQAKLDRAIEAGLILWDGCPCERCVAARATLAKLKGKTNDT